MADTAKELRHDVALANRIVERFGLSAAFGHVGNAGHPEVQAMIEDAIRRIVAGGKAAGILTTDDTLNRKYLSLGATFVAVGLDNNLLAKATSALAARFKGEAAGAPMVDSKTY